MLRVLALLSLTLLVALPACTSSPDAEAVIDRAIAAHGGEVLDRAVVEFDFRDAHFVVRRNGGRFRYERQWTDSTGQSVRDVLENDGVRRLRADEPVPLTEDERLQVETAVNSVVYFALLPYFLNDDAVQARYLGPATVNDAPYHEIEVTFRQDGGGRDWEDRFVYWFHRDRATMDYLAYSFHVNGGGTRFREAYNVRTVGGVRFADYRNYTSDQVGTAIEEYDTWPDDLKRVSTVDLDNITVRPLAHDGR
jgi:hypothetical protein